MSLRKIRACRSGSSRLFLAFAAACSDGTAPEPRVLQGQWGSQQAELVAILAGAELRLHCAVAVMDDPIVLTPANTFSARARVLNYRTLSEGSPSVVRLTGSIADGQVTISVPEVTISVPSPLSLAAETYVLSPGVEKWPSVCARLSASNQVEH